MSEVKERIFRTAIVVLSLISFVCWLQGCKHVETPKDPVKPAMAIPTTAPEAKAVKASAETIGDVAASVGKSALVVQQLDGGKPVAESLIDDSRILYGEHTNLAAMSEKLIVLDAKIQIANKEAQLMVERYNELLKKHAEEVASLKEAQTTALGGKDKEIEDLKKKYAEEQALRKEMGDSIFRWSMRILMLVGSVLVLAGGAAAWFLRDYMLAVGGGFLGMLAIGLSIVINQLLKWSGPITWVVLGLMATGIGTLIFLAIKRLHESVDEQTCLTQGVKEAAKAKGVDLTDDVRKLGDIVLSPRTKAMVKDLKKANISA